MRYSYLILIIEDIKRRKFSSFLTFFAISLGILSIFMIVILSTSFENSIQKQFEELGTNRLYITTSSGLGGSMTEGFDDNDRDFIESQTYVDKVYPYYMRGAQIQLGREFQANSVAGVELTNNYFQDLNFELDQGRIPNLRETNSVVIGSAAVENIFSKELTIGSNIYIREEKFKVVGILQSVGNPEDDNLIYANIDTIRDLYGDPGEIGVFDVLIVEGEDMKFAQENLQNALDRELGEDTTNVISPTQVLEQLNSILSIVNYTLGGIALVALLVGAFGIINTMYVIVTEKTRDIGIMKSIGARNEDILFLFMAQAGIFGLFGAILGVIIGVGVSFIFEEVASNSGFSFLEITIDPMLVVGLIFFGFITGIISGFLPAYRASKISIIDSIRK